VLTAAFDATSPCDDKSVFELARAMRFRNEIDTNVMEQVRCRDAAS